jgi:hypothetical protein
MQWGRVGPCTIINNINTTYLPTPWSLSIANWFELFLLRRRWRTEWRWDLSSVITSPARSSCGRWPSADCHPLCCLLPLVPFDWGIKLGTKFQCCTDDGSSTGFKAFSHFYLQHLKLRFIFGAKYQQIKQMPMPPCIMGFISHWECN